MADSCKKCGAPANASLTICEFCGAATIDLQSAADELRAIEEMVQVERNMATEKSTSSNPLMGALNPLMDIEKQNRVMALWTGSFIPNHPESLKRLLQIVIQKAVGANMGTSYKDKYVARAQSLLSTYKIQCVSDPEYGVVVTQYEVEIGRESKKGSMGMLKWIGLALGVMVGISLLIIFISGGPNQKITERKCKGEDSDCDERCQLANCLELCEDDNQWACQLVIQLMPNKNAPFRK